MTLLSNFILKLSKIAGFLCFSFPVYANICENFYKKPDVKTKVEYGEAVFKSVPKAEILSLEKLQHPNLTLGVTLADFSIEYNFAVEKYKIDGGACAVLSNVDFVIGYKNMDVLIEDKYKENSCEYKAIKEHELGHVDIYKKELKYYGNLILKELERIAFDIEPVFFSGAVSEKKVANKIQKIIFENDNINILKNKLEKALVDKNQLYDNADEYARVKASCRGW